MPEVLINGEKKKVACGPCIRGHRSSKCAHKDRVLIEVRKPGRPLSACPHPAGSCSCERAVIYTIPKSSECPCPTTSSSFSPSPSIATGRVQKSKVRKSLSNVTPSTVQRAIGGDAATFGQTTTLRNDNVTSTSSDTSSNTPSLASSTSSTPQINAIDMGGRRNDTLLQESIFTEIKDENSLSRPQLDSLDAGNLRALGDEIGWTGDWPKFHPSSASIAQHNQPARISSCCQPQSIPEEQNDLPPPPSCCASKPNEFEPPAQNPQDSHQFIQQNTRQMQRDMHNGFGGFGNQTDFGFSFGDPFTLPDASTSSLQPGPSQDFFGQLEGQHGCNSYTHVPRHINGSSDDHNCHCGERCACLGCATHPANRTTTEYVRYHNELASRGYLTPSRMQRPLTGFHQQLSFGLPSAQNQFGSLHPVALQGAQQSQYGSQFNPAYIPASGYAVPAIGVPSWPMGAHVSVHTPANELQQFHLNSPIISSLPTVDANFQSHNESQSHHGQNYHGVTGPSHQQSTPKAPSRAFINEAQRFELTQRRALNQEAAFDHESPSTDDDTSTLSPSSFHIQQFNVPGCNDVTGTCCCGDGCQCPGCQTHSGHSNEAEIELAAESVTPVDRKVGRLSVSHGPDLNGFSIDNSHSGLHGEVFSSTTPGG